MKRFFLSLLFVVSPPVMAVELTGGDYQGREDVSQFISQMVESSNYTEGELVELFSQVVKQEHLFEKLNRPAEKELEWHQYRRIFIKENRIDQGVDFWREHQAMLESVSASTGVPEEIIVAIIGVETFYGAYKGRDPVFDSLVTLAFDYPKRAKFFTRELEQFLLLVKEQDLAARELKGSYAGAMGMPQFISSSYRYYAVDQDQDGSANLFDSIPDIIGSVANYFVKHGWEKGLPVARPLIALERNTIGELNVGIKPEYRWEDLKRSGLATRFNLDDEAEVALIRLQQKDHPEFWAGFENFYVITRYNHSEMYAMAVYQLAKLIRYRYRNSG